jgi:O-antigen/teichoic acid export membrane protein
MSALRASGALFISNTLALGLQLVVVGCYGRRLDDTGLSDYQIVLAMANAVVPLLTCGLNDALSFLLGRKYDAPREAQGMVLQSVLFLSATTLALALIAALLPDWSSRLVFKQSNKTGLVLVMLLFMFSRALFDFQCRYLLSRKQIWIPVLSMVLIPGVIPLAVLWIDPTYSLERLLLESSILTLILLAFPSWHEYRRHTGAGPLPMSWESLRYLLKLGVPRVPTILGMSLLVSCQVFLARQMNCTMEEQVIIGSAMMIVRTLAMAQRVVTSIVEPQIGWTSRERPEVLPVLLRTLTLATVAVGVGATATLLATGDTILRIWIKRPEMPIGFLGMLFWISAFPFTLLFVLRPCVNALSPQAHNTKNMLHSLIGMGGVLLVAWFITAPPALAIGSATLLSSALMAVFSLATVQKLVKIYTRKMLLNVNTLAFAGCSMFLLAVGVWAAPEENFLAPRALAILVLLGTSVLLYLTVIGYRAHRTYRNEIHRLNSVSESVECPQNHEVQA